MKNLGAPKILIIYGTDKRKKEKRQGVVRLDDGALVGGSIS